MGTQPLFGQSTVNRSPLSDEQITQISFKPPSYDRKPKKTSGAGSRQDNDCSPTDAPSFMPLVPADGEGLTVAAYPTFWVYLPKTSAKQVILSIKEEGIQHHSQTSFSIEGMSGIIGFQTSESSPPLAEGKTYQWTVVLVCGAKVYPNDLAVVAWVRRINLPPSLPTTLLQQAVWYGEQGIWYDLLSAIAQAKSAQSDQPKIASIWSNFLASVGFEAIATQPLTLNPNQ